MEKLFESYGETLRNLLTPYWNLLEAVKTTGNLGINEGMLRIIMKSVDFDLNKKELIEFSLLPALEQMNIRETDFRGYSEE